jgi:hypothetical protein
MLLFFQPPSASASASAPPTPTPDGRATTFQAVEGGPEQHSGSTLLVEAYCVLWVILMTWIVLLWRKQAKLHTRLDDLEKAIDVKAAAAPQKKK